MHFTINNKALCEQLWNRDLNDKVNEEKILMNSIKANNSFSEEQLRQIREKLINTFLPTFKRQWQNVSRKKDKFINQYDCYLKKILQLLLIPLRQVLWKLIQNYNS